MPWFIWDCPSFSTESRTESLVSGEIAQFQGWWTPYLEVRTLPEAQLQRPDWGRVWVQKLLRDQQHFPTLTGDKASHDSQPPTQMHIHRDTYSLQNRAQPTHPAADTHRNTDTHTQTHAGNSGSQTHVPRSSGGGGWTRIGTHSPLTTHSGNTNTYAQNHTVVKTDFAERHTFIS